MRDDPDPGRFLSLFLGFQPRFTLSCWIVTLFKPSYNPVSLAVLFVFQVGKKVLTFGEVAEVC
jgi:hypothetical protein